MRLSGIITIIICLHLAGCVPLPGVEQKAEEKLSLKETAFKELPGWESDNHSEAIAPLQKSCDRLLKKDPAAEMGRGGIAGVAAAWQEACEKISGLHSIDNDEARAFFEENFTPYEVWGNDSREGLFTGYYEPTLYGSFKKHGPFRIPLYGRPNDLVTVNLGDFRESLKGETIMGRVNREKLVPYYKRDEINKGALKKKKPIVWVDDAVDAFFLHIQGSGMVMMDNNQVLRVGYAAGNGHPYTAIGRELIKRGELTKENVSMQSIREWLAQHPKEAAELMNVDASYIFFRQIDPYDGPIGAEGVPLTPRRSMAVDRKKIPYGVPLWLDAQDPDGDTPLQRLMIAQDTGGAITGAVRGDFFWGDGAEAAHKAGLMKSRGHYWMLLPKSVTVPEATQQFSLARFFDWLPKP